MPGSYGSRSHVYGNAVVTAVGRGYASRLRLIVAPCARQGEAQVGGGTGAGAGPGFTAYRADHRAASTMFVPGFAETREDHRLAATVAEPGFTSFREDYRQLVTVTEPGFASFREDHRAVVGLAYTFPEVYGDDGAAALRDAPTSPTYQFPVVYGDDEAR